MASLSPPAVDEVILVTTADATGGRQAELRRLFDSVERFRAKRPALRLQHHLLLQRCGDAAAGAAELGAPAWMTVTAADRQIPLSAARNRMLDTILSEPLSATCIVAFPDDDAWYPEGTLEHVVDRFARDELLDLWFCRYGSQATFDPAQVEVEPSFQSVISYGSSNTFVLRGSLLSRIGGFDESLGLGTPAKSGEDTEFVIRAHLAARRTEFVNARMIGHRDFSKAVRAKYYGGSLAAIARHRTSRSDARLAFARKLLVGGALVAKRDLSLSELLGAWRMAGGLAKAPAHSERPSRIHSLASDHARLA